MVSRPVETAFTGPAATVLGLSALGAIGNMHTVALDIGGNYNRYFPLETGETIDDEEWRIHS